MMPMDRLRALIGCIRLSDLELMALEAIAFKMQSAAYDVAKRRELAHALYHEVQEVMCMHCGEPTTDDGAGGRSCSACEAM
jgi:hypothetical protein